MGKGTSSKSARRIGLPNILGAQHDCLGKTTLQTCTVPLAWQDVDCHCVVAFAVVLRNASFGFTMVGQSSAVLQCHIGGQFLGTVPEAPVTTPVRAVRAVRRRQKASQVRTAQCPSPNFDALSVGSTCENKSPLVG